MTAEIAVLNKLAVALAADSAVTLRGPETTKVYKTANKLFSLSKFEPVGVMVHGSAAFMGVPWETIIKAYRAQLGSKSFKTLREYLDHFAKAIQSNDVVNLADEETLFVRETVGEQFRRMRASLDKQVEQVLGGKTLAYGEIAEVFKNVLEGELGRLTTPSLLASLPPAHAENVLKQYGQEIDQLIAAVFEKHAESDEAKAQLRQIAVALFTRDSFVTSQASGIVVAGFGTRDVYPSLEVLQIHGRSCGELKSRLDMPHRVGVSMDAAIVPFAQREMVDAFMTGVDPRYEDGFVRFLRRFMSKVPDLILTDLPEVAKDSIPDIAAKWNAQSERVIDDFREEMTRAVREFSDPIVNTVAALPIDELATMAETLVNITSFKRKVTPTEETVGGPIDVAVISKGDGFVWIKRKHYFSADLNPHFATQYFRRGSTEAENVQKE